MLLVGLSTHWLTYSECMRRGTAIAAQQFLFVLRGLRAATYWCYVLCLLMTT